MKLFGPNYLPNGTVRYLFWPNGTMRKLLKCQGLHELRKFGSLCPRTWQLSFSSFSMIIKAHALHFDLSIYLKGCQFYFYFISDYKIT